MEVVCTGGKGQEWGQGPGETIGENGKGKIYSPRVSGAMKGTTGKTWGRKMDPH